MVAESSDEDDEEEFRRTLHLFSGTRPRDIQFLQAFMKKPEVTELKSGLLYRQKRPPSSPDAAQPGRTTRCRLHFCGVLTDGTEFDNTYSRRQAAIVSPDQVVDGWGEAMKLMREGEKWEIAMPSHLGYGEHGAAPTIPPGAALVLELELIEVGVKDSETSRLDYKPAIAAGIIFLGMLMALYLHYSREPSLPRGGVVSVAEASEDITNPRVFFDLQVGDKPLGRVEFELFAKVAPKTVENFRALATGEKGLGKLSHKKLHFKGTGLHRIIPGFVCQGGDFVSGDGRGGESIYGHMFKDEWEHGVIQHTESGLLSMANKGKDTNGSQFFITLAKAEWLDHRHVVFGRVVHGMEVVRMVERFGTAKGTPTEAVTIADSGELGRDSKPIQVIEHLDL